MKKKDMKLTKGKRYHAYWHDTLGIDHWVNEETIVEKAKECAQNQETIGFYVCTTSDYHVFASTINRAGGMLPYANTTLIPTGCIKKIRAIK